MFKATFRERGAITSQGLVALLGLFAGLCSLLAGVVTVADAWREHNEAGWPAVTATIEKCSLERYNTLNRRGPRVVWRVECRIRYEAGTEDVSTKIRSRSSPAGSGVALMNQWVAGHRPGSWMEVHYDPSDHRKAVLVTTDMPFAGPRTPNNLRLLLIAVVACVVLVSIARIMTKPTSSVATSPAR